MNRRSRRRFHGYLKPGALAKLRDSKINAKTHHRSSDSQIYLPRPTSPNAPASPHQQELNATVAAVDGGSPCFSVRFYGPRCPQRKKLMAARSIFYVNPNSADAPEPVIDPFANEFLVAH